MTVQYTLQHMEIEGFLSFANRALIDFSDVSGLRFLTGINKVEPRLGANGAGKSSMWEALFWCLYGTGSAGHKASDLTHWEYKRPYVQVVFDLDGDLLLIERWGSPERLLVNDQPATQSELDGLLGLSRARFAQSVIFGQRAPFFMDLSIPARGALLDEVLVLGIWGKASDVAVDRLAKLRTVLATVDKALAHDQGRQAQLPDPATITTLQTAWHKEKKDNIEKALVDVDDWEKEVAALTTDLADARDRYARKRDARRDDDTPDSLPADMAAACANLTTILARVDDIKRTAAFLCKEMAECPTCTQPITVSFRNLKLHNCEAQRLDINIDLDAAKDAVAALDELVVRRDAADKLRQQQLRVLEMDGVRDKAQLDVKKQSRDRAFAFAESLIIEYEEAPCPWDAVADSRAAAGQEIADLIAAHTQELNELNGTKLLLEYWQQGFKKVRLYLVNRILMQFQIETANAASLLGLADWHVDYVTETENKSGGIKQGVQILIRSPVADGGKRLLSGGEGQRVRLAIEMGLAGLVQRMAGVRYNIEVWDEPSGFLSDEGIADLLDCLDYRARTINKSVWLTDHRTYEYNFKETWTVVKTSAGSQVCQGPVSIGVTNG